MKRLTIIFLYFIYIFGTLWSEAVLSDYINRYRVSRGLSVLEGERVLEETALQYCRVLISEGKLSHRDSLGFRVLDRYRRNGGTASRAGEILGTATDAIALFQAWQDSPSHNNLMLSSRWSRIGEALLEEDGQYVAVVLFSDSLIDSYKVEHSEDGFSVNIKSLEDASIWARGNRSGISGEIDLHFPNEELPLLLLISGEKEGRKWSSDFLYLSDKILDETH